MLAFTSKQENILAFNISNPYFIYFNISLCNTSPHLKHQTHLSLLNPINPHSHHRNIKKKKKNQPLHPKPKLPLATTPKTQTQNHLPPPQHHHYIRHPHSYQTSHLMPPLIYIYIYIERV